MPAIALAALVLPLTVPPAALPAGLPLHEDPTPADLVEVALARDLPSGLTAGDRQALGRIAEELRSGRAEEAGRRWQKLVRRIARRSGPAAATALVPWTLREAYVDSDPDLSRHADQVRRTERERRAMRAQFEESHAAAWAVKLRNAEDDAALAIIGLEDAFEERRETLETMSSVSRMLHDTAMAVIRKLG